nr:reverse transcriptase domain-containing protein [Tanacetum cinerariifolium]
ADEEKTSFHTRQGVYCYTKMPFGLKNAGATYQRVMDKVFERQMRRNIEVYMDNLVVKSHTEAEMSDFHWTAEAEQAFQQLKQHLSDLPLLVAPRPQEELIMYLYATHGAISAVLMTERGTAQTPVYFISRALQGPELNYSPMEKLVLLLVFAAKRLRRYFKAHPITVITDQPIKQVMSRPDVAGRLQKWSILLGEHNITYRPRTQVPRTKNKKADTLSKITSTSFPHLSKQVLVEVLETKSITGKEVTAVIEEEGQTRMTELMDYLKIVIPAEMRMPTYHTASVDVVNNDEELQLILDLLEERRELAAPGDFMYRNNDASHAVAGGKLGPKWEGPYEVTEALDNGAYKLRFTDGTMLPRTWNVTNLKRSVDVVNNDKELRLNLDLLEERRELAAINEARSKSKMTKYYNSRVRGVAFQPKNFVYRSNDASHAAAGGKLGPYEVTDALGNGAYKLRSMDGMILPRTWNVINLKRCYL